jgi:hypothetical protein
MINRDITSVGNLHQEQCKSPEENPPGFGAMLAVQKPACVPSYNGFGPSRDALPKMSIRS